MKFKTKWEKILISTTCMLVGMIAIGGSTAKAALQANSTTHSSPAQNYGSKWISEIRKMENSGQTMGLSESQNSNLTPIGTNNIDVHMMRTTEYGAMAILSASGYGNPKMLSQVTTKTTTGNVTGVYIAENRWDWTAGTTSSTVGNVNARYYDNYTTTAGDAKVGDALGLSTSSNPGCVSAYSGNSSIVGWHGASYSEWLKGTNYGFFRGKVFSFRGNFAWDSHPNCGRGVAVVGQGL